MKPGSHVKNLTILAVLGLCIFMAGNGAINLTNPDEVFYAQTAREMSAHHSWMVPYLFGWPQFEKPIFTYWLLRIALVLFGASNFGARFFPALFALIGVGAVYWLAAAGLKDRKKAFLCAFVMMTSGLYIGLARTVFTDMIFSVFVLLSLSSFYWGYAVSRRKPAGILMFFIFSGLAVLSKGPLGFLIPGAVVTLFLATRKECGFFWCRYTAWGVVVFAAIALPWYAAMVRQFGGAFTQEFFYNDHLRRLLVAEHRSNDTWYFYPSSMVACMFPWSVFVAAGLWLFFRRLRSGVSEPFTLFLFWWFFVVFVAFQAAHSKLVSYIFPLFPVLAILAGGFIAEAWVPRPRRVFFVLSWMTWVLLPCVPAALIVCSRLKKYAAYVPASGATYVFIAVYTVLIAVTAYGIVKRKGVFVAGLLGLQVPFLLAFACLAHQSYDAFVSSKQSCAYLSGARPVTGTVLCSKLNVRGVRYFTDWPVAVINVGGGNYFSPHPIPFLNTDAKVRQFLKTQPVTYGILSKSGVNDLKKPVSEMGLKLDILEKIGDKFIVVVEPA